MPLGSKHLNFYSFYNNYEFEIEIFTNENNNNISYTVNKITLNATSLCYDSVETETGINCPIN